ncbi:hypothetical protein JVX98_12815 [Ensifer sp. PDNC004]|uniref:hypothetical protein n=1 Tax=Ensifer sp. PDNC004 TaxID=2811423 RepID=UPI00196506CE|nr:hypothetical protein [Ensifer sp. PDNC004]QRY69107.1 hypothetical protein JVX98_12815 [Ensifer sp. PDNC004]
MEKESEIIRTSLRLPKSLYDRLDRAATERGMTMHAEILARLETTFDHDVLLPVADQALDSLEDSIRESREMLQMQRDLVEELKGLRSIVQYIATNEDQPDPELKAALRAVIKDARENKP